MAGLPGSEAQEAGRGWDVSGLGRRTDTGTLPVPVLQEVADRTAVATAHVGLVVPDLDFGSSPAARSQGPLARRRPALLVGDPVAVESERDAGGQVNSGDRLGAEVLSG